MGSAVSSGVNNDDLVNNLVKEKYITSHTVEQVFRAVDRGHFVDGSLGDVDDGDGEDVASGRNRNRRRNNVSAYEDLAWREGNLHLSAPCIYTHAMEELELKPGLSFLNLGSGTGYLNLMVGHIIGPNCCNHGVEIHEDCIEYANERINSFVLNAAHFDKFNIGLPEFFHGNCLNLSSDCFHRYDRVYCGAAVPSEHIRFIQQLVKPEGIIVLPCGDKLVKIAVKDGSLSEVRDLLPVSFASLIVPSQSDLEKNTFGLPLKSVPSLKSLARLAVRTTIQNILFPPETVKIIPEPLTRSERRRRKRQNRHGRYSTHRTRTRIQTNRGAAVPSSNQQNRVPDEHGSSVETTDANDLALIMEGDQMGGDVLVRDTIEISFTSSDARHRNTPRHQTSRPVTDSQQSLPPQSTQLTTHPHPVSTNPKTLPTSTTQVVASNNEATSSATAAALSPPVEGSCRLDTNIEKKNSVKDTTGEVVSVEETSVVDPDSSNDSLSTNFKSVNVGTDDDKESTNKDHLDSQKITQVSRINGMNSNSQSHCTKTSSQMRSNSSELANKKVKVTSAITSAERQNNSTGSSTQNSCPKEPKRMRMGKESGDNSSCNKLEKLESKDPESCGENLNLEELPCEFGDIDQGTNDRSPPSYESISQNSETRVSPQVDNSFPLSNIPESTNDDDDEEVQGQREESASLDNTNRQSEENSEEESTHTSTSSHTTYLPTTTSTPLPFPIRFFLDVQNPVRNLDLLMYENDGIFSGEDEETRNEEERNQSRARMEMQGRLMESIYGSLYGNDMAENDDDDDENQSSHSNDDESSDSDCSSYYNYTLPPPPSSQRQQPSSSSPSSSLDAVLEGKSSSNETASRKKKKDDSENRKCKQSDGSVYWLRDRVNQLDLPQFLINYLLYNRKYQFDCSNNQ